MKVFGGLRISASPGPFFLYHEFSETADEEVFSALKGLLEDFEESFHDTPGLSLAESHIIVDITNRAGVNTFTARLIDCSYLIKGFT